MVVANQTTLTFSQLDHTKRRLASGNRLGVDSLIERSEFAFVRYGEHQQIVVGEMFRGGQRP